MGEYPARISAASILAEATARCKQKKLSGNRRIPGQDTEGETSASQSDLVALGAGGDDGGKDVHYFWFDLVNSGHMYRM